MKPKKEIKELIDWLKIDGNSQAKIAFSLGYKSTNTIAKWIANNEIPFRQRLAVSKIINGELDVTT